MSHAALKVRFTCSEVRKVISLKVSCLGRVVIIRPTRLELLALVLVLAFIGTVALLWH